MKDYVVVVFQFHQWQVMLSPPRTHLVNLWFWVWSAICFKIMTRDTCGFSPRILAIIPATRYTCVFLSRILAFFPALWGFYSQVYDHFLTNAHIYAHQKAHICVTNKHVVYAVTESRRIESTELYRQPKTPSCTIQMKGNFGLNQSWLQWSRSFRARFCSYSLPSQ